MSLYIPTEGRDVSLRRYERYLSMKIPTLKEAVKGKVTFDHYNRGILYYRTAQGFVFAVPCADTGTGTFFPSDKGIFFMRWIRPALEEMSKP